MVAIFHIQTIIHFSAVLVDHQVTAECSSGGVGKAKSLMCDNFIEVAHYFEQMAAFYLFGD